jgi:biotin carboxyl carrier protein
MKVDVKAPVTGTIWMLSAGVGQQVYEGNDLMTMESMKMEVPVAAPCNGEVTWLRPQGDQVNVEDLVAIIEDGT